jgi:dipeptidyl aminopeptidase/acylaminoacyl peptidase
LVERIPLEVLFGNPERTSPRLSPDGERLAYLRPVGGVLNVWVGSVTVDDARPVTADVERGIRAYGWAHDNRHLFYVQDLNGDENWHLYTIDLVNGDVARGEVVDRTPFDGAQARLAGRSRRKPHELLVEVNADDRRFHDVYRLDLASGTLDKVLANPGFDEWLVDLDLTVRGGRRTTATGALEYLLGDGDPSTWPVVLTVAPEDATLNTSGVLSFDAEGESLYMLSPVDANATRLVRVDLSTGTVEVLLEDASYDVAGATLHPESREPQIATIERDRADVVVLDPAIAGDIEALRDVDDGDLHIASRDHADARWVVAYQHDAAPIRYYVYERDTKRATFLFADQPALNDFTLASAEPFAFTASDGLAVHGYATFPPGAGREGLPTVLHVHGGPWGARHSWGYEPTRQWLANRGFLCLEINYRGSGGYGKAFLNASAREWGGRMHTDLIEGAEFAIGEGWTDAERIAIFGGSYGGYAALVGATFTPDFFRCAVDIVGPSNLITLLETVPPYWVGVKQVFYRLLGHPDRDRDFLWERSPLSRVDQIRTPLLIAQGANDPRVNQAESEQIVAALTEQGIDHEYMLFPDEGHGFAKPENRLRFYEAADRFLAEHMLDTA